MDCEICIVGGGLVGLAAALAFGTQGRSVQLFEARPYDTQNNQPSALDVRSIALSYSTTQIFQSLGIWDELKPNCAAINQIHVSSAGHFGVTRLNASELNLPSMGQVIEYHVLAQQLLVAVQKQQNIEICSPARVTEIIQHDDGVAIAYQSGQTEHRIKAGVLVVAEGAGSSIGEMLGITTQTVDYEQTAIVANVKIQQPESGCAYERFTAQGPMAMLPLPQQRYAMVWTNTHERAGQLMEMSEKGFIENIYKQFGLRLGYFEQLGRRDQFALKMRRADKLVSGRCVLIGNAANALHPVAGQGFNLGMRDIAQLYDDLCAVDLSEHSTPELLERYQQQRIQDHEQTVALGNGLVQLFSNNLPVINHLRAAGLAIMDLCPTLKNQMGWQGMGYGASASSLMRGVAVAQSQDEGNLTV